MGILPQPSHHKLISPKRKKETKEQVNNRK